MQLETIVTLCSELLPELDNSSAERLQIYDDGIFRVEGEREDFLDGKELIAFYRGTQVLWYRENYANNRYRPIDGCETYLASDEFTRNYVKQLLRA
jgi:hypothetical protein